MGQGSPVPTVVILRGEIFFAFGLIFELEVNCSPIFHSQSNKAPIKIEIKLNMKGLRVSQKSNNCNFYRVKNAFLMTTSIFSD